MGLRLKLRKAQAEAGDIVLLFCDESEALTHPYLARAWAKRGWIRLERGGVTVLAADKLIALAAEAAPFDAS